MSFNSNDWYWVNEVFPFKVGDHSLPGNSYQNKLFLRLKEKIFLFFHILLFLCQILDRCMYVLLEGERERLRIEANSSPVLFDILHQEYINLSSLTELFIMSIEIYPKFSWKNYFLPLHKTYFIDILLLLSMNSPLAQGQNVNFLKRAFNKKWTSSWFVSNLNKNTFR